MLYDKFKNWLCTDGVHPNNIWIISDPHFSDVDFIEDRNYPGDEEFIRRINSKVGKKDTLIILGDIGNIEQVKKLKGYKVLIKGNHDKGITNYKRVVNEYETFDSSNLKIEDIKTITLWHKTEGEIGPILDMRPLRKYFHKVVEDNHLFDEVYQGILVIDTKLVLSHIPVHIDGLYNIHGHEHCQEITETETSLNVSAEYLDYYPISLISFYNSGRLSKIKDIFRLMMDKKDVNEKDEI